MTEPVALRPARAADAEAVAAIYNHYVRETVITFEEVEVSAAAMADRMAAVQALPLPWLVAESGTRIVGYAYADRWRTRSAYRFSVESSVYLDPEHTGLGIGGRLYGALLPALGELGVHAVIAGITLPNAPSVALHERFGFVKVAHFAEVGRKFGRWLDVGYWQVLP
jgi:phosphinothricin acetyltransferase